MTENPWMRTPVDCPQCGHSMGSRFHEVSCDPAGNLEDGPVPSDYSAAGMGE
jgi:hypothetical protein